MRVHVNILIGWKETRNYLFNSTNLFCDCSVVRRCTDIYAPLLCIEHYSLKSKTGLIHTVYTYTCTLHTHPPYIDIYKPGFLDKHLLNRCTILLSIPQGSCVKSFKEVEGYHSTKSLQRYRSIMYTYEEYHLIALAYKFLRLPLFIMLGVILTKVISGHIYEIQYCTSIRCWSM